jgi:hypothetical protein
MKATGTHFTGPVRSVAYYANPLGPRLSEIPVVDQTDMTSSMPLQRTKQTKCTLDSAGRPLALPL